MRIGQKGAGPAPRVVPLVVAASLFASACTPAPTAQPTASPAAAEPTAKAETTAASPTARATATPSPAEIGKPLQEMAKPTGPVNDTIVISMGLAPDTLHPLIGSMLARSEVLGALFTYPVHNDNRGEWVPIGVERVPTIENGGARFVGEGDDRHLEVTFKIREGVKWHDGVPTTSKDIQYTWELYMDPNFPATEREQASKVYAIDAPDSRTAVVKYMSAKQARSAAANGHRGLDKDLWAAYVNQKEPLTDPLYFQLPQGQGEWLPEHILSKIPPEQHQASDWANKPIGNGSYKIVEVVPEQSIRLEAVPDYFLGAPPTKNLVFRIIADPNAALAALKAGEIDVATQVQGPEIDKAPELDRLSGYKASYIPGTPWEHVDLNMDDTILKEKNIRKALILAINRQQIVDALLFGKTRVATSWIQPGLPAWAYDESCSTQYRYDPAAAARLLEQAGYTRGGDGIYQKNGQRLSLRLETTDQPLRRTVSQVIQQNLRDAGVQLDLDFIPGRGLFGKDGPLAQRTFQLGLYTWLANPDPDASLLYKSTTIPSPENNFTGQNNPGFKNPKFDELMIRGANELSVEKRKQIYCEAQKIWTDEVPVIPLFQRLVVTTARANMANYRPTPTLTPETWNSWAWFIPAS